MKRYFIKFGMILIAINLVSLTACAKNNEPESEKSKIECINEQLEGTWTSQDATNVYSKWTFYDGKYVVDTYVNGKKLDNSTVGTYFIGENSIHTLTSDQVNNVEGEIPFTYENGILILNGASGMVTKD